MAVQIAETQTHEPESALNGWRPDQRPHILIVDDENGPRQALRMLLKEDFTVHLSTNVGDALEVLDSEPVELIITDVRMPKRTGVDLLREAKAKKPDVQVIILTGYGQLETAVKAVEYGAFTYMEKPFDNEAMLEMIQAGLEKFHEECNRRALERLALEANRFETFGRVVSGMMHDLGSPLTVLSSQLEILSSGPQRDDLPQRLETMYQQVQHCNDMVRTTMNFLRHDSQAHTRLRLNSVLDSALEVAAPLLRDYRVEGNVNLGDCSSEIKGDPVMLRQGILNLISNSCQAMEDWNGPRTITISTWLEHGHVHLAVQDSGPGVPEEQRESIFETFFSTKSKGTGLGLGVVRNIMNRHGGTVSLDTATQSGARFVLRFPIMT